MSPTLFVFIFVLLAFFGRLLTERIQGHLPRTLFWLGFTALFFMLLGVSSFMLSDPAARPLLDECIQVPE